LQPFRPQNLGCLLNGCKDLCPGRDSVSRTPRNVTLAGTRFCFPLRPLHILAPLYSSRIKGVASSRSPPPSDVVESRKSSGGGLPILRRPRQERAVSPSGSPTSEAVT